MTVPGRLRIGCAVWAYAGWLGDVYPRGTRAGDYLWHYARRFDTVEGNTTFYALPEATTVARWVAATPETFRFCCKVSRDISHATTLDATGAATARFVERLAPLGVRLGRCFLQLPPGFAPARLAELARWLARWPATMPLAVEVRHLDWFAEPASAALDALLADHRVARVTMDVRPLMLGDLPGAEEDLHRARDRKPDVPCVPAAVGGAAFVRYIGHPDVPRNAALLDGWAGRITAWRRAGIDVDIFAHCPVERSSPQIAAALAARLGHAPDGADAAPRQTRLF
ncbi:MAG: DUF72 domain-containing protein [Chloroflexi bacterium]|nr:DUF72 domain-containing protein [Chloroflexota bacterium]